MNFGIIGFGRIARKFVQAIEATDEGKIYAIGSRSVFMDDPYLKEHSVADAVESVLLAKDFMIFQLRSGQVVDTVERIHFDVEPL